MSFDRAAALARLADEEFDVLVIGGGITGAGIALDAATRGLKTALVEGRDFASGTSSKSSKLVHGGLRYLQQKEFLLVYENLAERQRLLDNAPHLVKVLPFLIPLFGKDGAVNKTVAKTYSIALWLYDLTGGVRIGKRHKRISVDDAVAHMPTLRRDRLVAAFLYYDAQADDARLTLTILRTAVDHGAVAANYCPVAGLVRNGDGRVRGARLADGTEVRASVVVNAAGVWADEVRALDEGAGAETLRPAKGIHITVPWDKVQCDIAGVVPVPKDRRSIFVVPWGDRVYLGTTDTDYDGSLEHPLCTAEDVQYILRAINASISSPISESDVLSTWAGLRPLVASANSERTADLSRRHSVSTSESGLVTVTGGKLTTYRKMAADTVDEVLPLLGRSSLKRSQTKSLRLHGADGHDRIGDEHLRSRYGADARVVEAMVAKDASLGEPLVAGLPYLRAEAVYAARYEMVHTLEDVLSRRTRALLLARDASVAAAADVAALIGPELGWDADEQARQVAAFTALAEREREAAGLPVVGVGA